MAPQALRYFQEIQTVVRICGITYCHSVNDPNRGQHGHPRRLGWGTIHSHFVHLFFHFQLNPLSHPLLWLLPPLPSLMLRSGCIDRTLRGLDCNMGLMCAPLYLLPSEVGSVRWQLTDVWTEVHENHSALHSDWCGWRQDSKLSKNRTEPTLSASMETKFLVRNSEQHDFYLIQFVLFFWWEKKNPTRQRTCQGLAVIPNCPPTPVLAL